MKKSKLHYSTSLPQHDTVYNTNNQLVKKEPVTFRLLMSTLENRMYTRPYIYFGAKKGKKDITKPWSIRCRYNGKPIQKKGGINYYDTLRERTEAAQIYLEAFVELLEEGYNPFAIQMLEVSNSREAHQQMLLTMALDWAYNGHKDTLAKTTAADWGNIKDYMKDAIRELGLEMPIKEVRKFYVLQIIDKCAEMRKLSLWRWNYYLETFSALMQYLVKKDVLDFNPAHNIEKKKRPKAVKHTPPTTEELHRIASHLRQVNFYFYVFAKLELRTGTRPDEFLDVKISHLYLDSGFVHLIPDKETSKKKNRLAALDEELVTDIKWILSQNPYRPDDYLFSDDLAAGDHRIPYSRIETLWKKHVHEELQIFCTLYSLKHKGANMRRQMGNSIKAIGNNMGHSVDVSTKMTEIYLTEEKARMFEEVKAIMPPFG